MTSLVRMWLPATVCLLALAGSTPSPAAPAPAGGGKSVVLPFPAKAQLVVQLHGLDAARDRIKVLLAAALPAEAAKLTKGIDEGFHTLLTDRKTTAIPKDGRWFAVARDLGALGEEETPIAVLIPVADTKSFRESFLTTDEQKSFEKGEAGIGSFKAKFKGDDKTVYLVEQPGYVALTPSKATAEVYAGKFDRATAENMGTEVTEALLGSDVSAYLNMDAINEQFGAQIQQAKQFLDFAFQQAQGAGAGVSKQQIEAAKAVFKGMFQGVEDSRALVLGTEFRPTGLAVRIFARFADDTPTGKLLRNERTSDLAELGKLPKGDAFYTAGMMGQAIREAFEALNQQVTAQDDDEKGAALVKQYFEDIKAAGREGEIQAASPPKSVLVVTHFKDPAKAVAANTRLFKSLSAGAKFSNVVLKEKPKVKENVEKLGGFTFNEVRLTLDFEATVKDLPEQLKEATIASMKGLLGDSINTFYGTDGKVLVSIVAKDWDTAKKVFTTYRGGKALLGDDRGFQLTRKNLPVGASVIGVADMGQLVGLLSTYMKSMADAIPGFPAQLPDLKPVKGDPAYVGAALTLKPEILRVDLFVPVSAVQVVRKMLAPVLQKIE